MATWKEVAKKLAEETLGEDSIESLGKMGRSAIDTGKKAAEQVNQTIKQSDNSTIIKARNIVSAVKNTSNQERANTAPTIMNKRDYPQNTEEEKTLISMTCPNCGATLEVQNGIDTMCCHYCGTSVVINNQRDATIRARETVKKLEHKEIMADKVLEHLNSRSERKAAEREKQRIVSTRLLIVLVAVLAISMGFVFINTHNNKKAEQEQDVRFQEILLEIEEDINNEDYDAALIKANQLYLVTKTPVGNELKKKWDNTRKALIKQIEELQKSRVTASANPAPTPKANIGSSSTSVTNKKATTAPKDTIDYSTNDSQTVKNGNTGIYAYQSIGGSYAVYYLIDFDSGYVYYFTDGNGEETCDRVRIDSGDLNSVVIITYHDGGDTWQYGLHFKWKSRPETLVVQDSNGYEYCYNTTDLDTALKLRDSKSIKDY